MESRFPLLFPCLFWISAKGIGRLRKQTRSKTHESPPEVLEAVRVSQEEEMLSEVFYKLHRKLW